MLIIAFFVPCLYYWRELSASVIASGQLFQLTQAESLHCAPHKIRSANLARAKVSSLIIFDMLVSRLSIEDCFVPRNNAY
jgi:hypothetical protein